MRISSQRYIDQEIVERKIKDQDFVVTLAAIENDGDEFEIVIDGHHSLEAAKQAGLDPVFEYADYDYQKEADHLGFDGFLEAHWIDSDWYNIDTGYSVW